MRRPVFAAASVVLALAVIVAAPSAALAAPAAGSAHPALAPLPGDTSDFSFRSFDSVYQLSRATDRHAQLTTTETIVALFPQTDQNRGIIRAIPDRYGEVPLQTRVESVVDQHGAPVHYDQSRDGDFIDLALGTNAYVHGATTYVIRYAQRDTIRSFSDTDSDEFYWDVNGTGWKQPFAEVSARLEVAADVTPALSGHAACYQGPENSSDPCDGGIRRVDAGATASSPAPTDAPAATPAVYTASAHDLAPGGNLTISVGFAKGTFVEGVSDRIPAAPIPPPKWWQVVLGLAGVGSLVPGIVAFVLGRSRRPRGGAIIVPEYAPPAGLGILAAARLLDRPAQTLPAELVDLAVRGRIRLLGYPTQTHRTTADYAVQLLDAAGVDAFEKQYLDALFGADAAPGAARDLMRDGDATLGAALEKVKVAADAWVDGAGFFGPRGSSRAAKVWLGVTIGLCVVGVVGVFVGGVVGFALGFVGFFTGVVGLILGILGAVGRKRPTELGQRMIDHLLGMRMYMQLAEADRMRVLQSPKGAERIDTTDGRQIVKLHEKLLPWAVLWGIEGQWTAELQTELSRVAEAPDWYVGPQPFSAAMFAPILSGMSQGLTAPAPTASWSGSGGSSFSGGSFGGGFSGGGGGGGGGGGR